MLCISDYSPFSSSSEVFFKNIRLDLMEDDLKSQAIAFYNGFKDTLRPRFNICECKVHRTGADLCLDSFFFSGEVLKRLPSSSVYPYVVTCGNEMENINLTHFDEMASFWVDVLKREALDSALNTARTMVMTETCTDKLSSINPGSGKAGIWDISQLSPLLELINLHCDPIVKLSDSYCMIPNKSIAGIWFYCESEYNNCEKCPRLNCPDRFTQTSYSR